MIFVRERFSGWALLSTRSGFTKPRHSLLFFGSGVAERSVSRAVSISVLVCEFGSSRIFTVRKLGGDQSAIPEYHTSLPHVSACGRCSCPTSPVESFANLLNLLRHPACLFTCYGGARKKLAERILSAISSQPASEPVEYTNLTRIGRALHRDHKILHKRNYTQSSRTHSLVGKRIPADITPVRLRVGIDKMAKLHEAC